MEGSFSAASKPIFASELLKARFASELSELLKAHFAALVAGRAGFTLHPSPPRVIHLRLSIPGKKNLSSIASPVAGKESISFFFAFQSPKDVLFHFSSRFRCPFRAQKYTKEKEKRLKRRNQHLYLFFEKEVIPKHVVIPCDGEFGAVFAAKKGREAAAAGVVRSSTRWPRPSRKGFLSVRSQHC